MATDFPTGVTDTAPTFLMGGNEGNSQPAKLPITAAGRAMASAATAAAQRGLVIPEFALTVTSSTQVTVAPGKLPLPYPATLAGASLTSGQTTVSVRDNSAVYVGQRVYGTGVPAGTTITGVVPNVSITLSSAATSTVVTTLVTEGSYWSFAGGTANLPHLNNGDGEWYIGIDPNTNTNASGTVLGNLCSKVHAFRWKIHSSMIWLARVSRTGSTVTVVETYTPTWPKSGIARFKAKCQAAASGTTGAPVRIAIIGTSLSNFPVLSSRLNLDSVPTSTTCDWPSLVFSSDVSGSSAPYRIPYRTILASRFTVDNFSMSSNNVHYHACWLADGIVTTGTAPGQAIALRPGSFEKQASTSWQGVRKSPLITEPYDLVIIDSTPNGGTHKMAHLDNLVRKLKAAGSDVVLVRALQTDATAVPDLLAFTVPELVKIADARGCDICDWASFHWEAIDQFATRTDAINGGSDSPAYGKNQVLQDTIHPSQNRNGVGLSAEAIRSILCDLPMAAKESAPWVANRVVTPDGSLDPTTAAPYFPTHYEFCAFPTSVAGAGVTYNAGAAGIVGGNIVANNKMPEVPIGGKTFGSTSSPSAPVISLSQAGDTLKFSHPFAIGADVLVDYTGVTYSFTLTDGTNTLATCTASSGSLGSAKGYLFEGPQVGTTANWMPTQSATQLGGPFANTCLSVVWASGTPLIRGVLWHLPGEITDIPASGLRYTGTWSTTSATTGTIPGICRATNTSSATDYADFSVEGRMAFLHIEQTPASGFLDIWVNGEKLYTALDTYVAAAQQGYIKILPNIGGAGTNAPSQRLPELGTSLKMDIRVAYTGSQNASASAPAGNNYRLKVVGVSVVK